MAPRQVFEVEAVGDTNVVTLTQGVFDTRAARTLDEELSRLVGEPGRPNLLLDFASVESLTAAGLGRLVALNQAVRAAGGRLTLVNVAPLPYSIFEVVHLTRVLDIRQASGKGILVVEEDATRQALKTLLERQGYNVAWAADGREALDLLRADGPPSLILLDSTRDGWEFRREQGLDPALASIPVVVVSASTDAPVAPGELAEAVRRLLA